MKAKSKARPLKLVGQKFGRLTCMELLDEQDKNGRWLYLWKCDCGNTIVAPSNNIKYGLVIGCGCGKHDKRPYTKPYKTNETNILGVIKTYKRKNGEYSYTAHFTKFGVRTFKTCKTLEEAIECRKKFEKMYGGKQC